MSNLFTSAAAMMSGGDDLTVHRNDGIVTHVTWTHSGQDCEYLRGIVELITEHLGLQQQDGFDKTVVYENVLRRIDDARVTDL